MTADLRPVQPSAARSGRAASRVPDLAFRGLTGAFGVARSSGSSSRSPCCWSRTARLALQTFGSRVPHRNDVGSRSRASTARCRSSSDARRRPLIAIVLATPIGLLTAIFLAELAPRRVAIPLTFTIELLAAIPSVVFGLWGVFVLSPVPAGRRSRPWISGAFGWIPIFAGPPFGIGLFAAGVILTLMILPTIVAISRDVITSVPNSQREAMLALGATRWEIDHAGGPALRPLRDHRRGHPRPGPGARRDDGRDDGHRQRASRSRPASSTRRQTIASQIATTFNEASIGLQTSALIGLGLVLLVITMSLNVVARLLVWRVAGTAEAATDGRDATPRHDPRRA